MRSLLLLPLILFPALVEAAPKPEIAKPDGVVSYRKTEQVELTMEVFRPKGWKASDRRPAIVFFFGGGWVGGTTKQFHPQATHLAKRGMIAYCANYRVKSRHKTTPFDAVADAKAAVRWLWRNAAKQGIDPARLVSSGGSAGGHLAASTGVVPGFDAAKEGEPEFLPAALVLFNPVIDTSKEGYGFNALRDRYKELSPVEHVHDKAPPTLIMVGTADTTTPPKGDRLFGERMKQKERLCEVEYYEGQKHGFFNARGNNENYWKTLKRMEQFLEKQGFLSKEK